MRFHRVLICSLVLVAWGSASAPASTRVVSLESTSPLYEIQIMVRAGSAQDPPGKEGTASLVATALLEGGFGDPKNPVTKERVAEITRPWGSGAAPSVLTEKQTTTFSVVVPRDSFGRPEKSIG